MPLTVTAKEGIYSTDILVGAERGEEVEGECEAGEDGAGRDVEGQSNNNNTADFDN